jgi:Tfp pilus assembly protein PilF
MLRGRIDTEQSHDFTGEGVEDEHGHGTLVALLLLRTLEQVVEPRFLNLKCVGRGDNGQVSHLVAALQWLQAFKQQHQRERVFANLSLGKLERRLLGLRSCKGTCKVCQAAISAAEQDIAIFAAVGRTPGKTWCPASAARAGQNSIVAVAAEGDPESGIGNISGPATAVGLPLHGRAPMEAFVGSEASKYLFALGFSLSGAGDTRQAEKAYRFAMKTDDSRPAIQAAYNLGILLQRNGDADGARDAFETVMRSAFPDLAARAAVNLGALLVNDDPGAAMDAFRIAIKSGDKEQTAKAASNLGQLLGRENRWAEAATEFRRAVDTGYAEVMPSAAYNLGIALVRDGKTSLSLHAFEATIIAGDSPYATMAAEQIGNLLRDTNPERAREAYELATSSPEPEIARRAAVALDALPLDRTS